MLVHSQLRVRGTKEGGGGRREVKREVDESRNVRRPAGVTKRRGVFNWEVEETMTPIDFKCNARTLPGIVGGIFFSFFFFLFLLQAFHRFWKFGEMKFFEANEILIEVTNHFYQFNAFFGF